MASWQCPNCMREFKNKNQNHYCSNIETVEHYITQQPKEVQPLLDKIRNVAATAAPHSEERISYKMPAIWQGEVLLHFAAFKKHISIFPGAEATAFFADRLGDFKTNKGTIQFPLNKAIPYELIDEILRFRIASLQRDAQKSANKSNTASNKKNIGKQNAQSREKDKDISAKPRMTRSVHEIPDFVAAALEESGLWGNYNARPPYQRNDYIGWISNAKREETRKKRLSQMLGELQRGDAYMGMGYKAKTI